MKTKKFLIFARNFSFPIFVSNDVLSEVQMLIKICAKQVNVDFHSLALFQIFQRAFSKSVHLSNEDEVKFCKVKTEYTFIS